MSESSELIRLVKRMREYQRKFFRSRDRFDMMDAKKAERDVDAWLKRYETEQRRAGEPDLPF